MAKPSSSETTGMNQRPSYGRNRVTKLLGLFPAIEKWVESKGCLSKLLLGTWKAICELKTTIDVGLFDRENSMETIGKQYEQSSDVARHTPSLSDIMYMSYTPFCLTIGENSVKRAFLNTNLMLSIYCALPSGPPKADREVSAYKYKHFDAVKALRDNPDLMRSASGDALYGSHLYAAWAHVRPGFEYSLASDDKLECLRVASEGLAQAHVFSQATQQPFQIDWHLHAQSLIPAVHTIRNNDGVDWQFEWVKFKWAEAEAFIKEAAGSLFSWCERF
ncbi:hypothetical protein Tco_0044302 [Tanacetum coccineum]